MDILTRIKTLLGLDSDKDALLSILIEDAEQEFMDMCNRDDIPDTANGLIAQMVMHKYNQLGSEGIASQGFSGVSQSFMNDYPETIKKAFAKYRKLKVM